MAGTKRRCMAVGVNDRYALGWFNLGVALSHLGPSRFLAAQGALSRAVQLDPSLRFRKMGVVSDDEPYFTTLDLSKPLPPQWSFATSRRRGGFAVATVVVLGLLLRGWFRSWQAYWRDELNWAARSEEHTSELQSRVDLVCRLLLEKKKEYRRRPYLPQRELLA